ncbi:acyltransferase [Vibrio parahaemolyticus]|nr:acyltransferase [Vibrio parahaemolyticus]
MKENNFNLLRFILACIVLLYHAMTLNNIELYQYVPAKFAVYAFFSISGFFIINSWVNRRQLGYYFCSRFFRLYPLYFVVIASSVIYGLYNYSGTFIEYFRDGALKYFLVNASFLNFMAPDLPEIFKGNNISAVNGSLWTLKIEVMFYVLVPLVFFSSTINTKKLALVYYIFSIILYYFVDFIVDKLEFPIQFKHQLPSMLSFFFIGYLILSSKIKNVWLILMLIVSLIGYFFDLFVFSALFISVLVYIFAYKIKLPKLPKKLGDLSYGIYIWHFPIIQILISHSLFECFYVGFLITVLIVFLLSFFSWQFIEKQAISYGKRLST